MLTKEISEVEKGCGRTFKNNRAKLHGYKIFCGTGTAKDNLCPTCQAKLSTLKSAQAKFDKFVEDLKEEMKDENGSYSEVTRLEKIDKLYSEVSK